MSNPDILLLSGEQSGDQLALKLVQDIKQQFPDLHIAGMGGTCLEQSGMEILVDNKDLAIIGLWEVVRKIKLIWRAWQKLKAVVKRSTPLVILVDYPGMNLRFSKLAKKNGCKVLYYVSPQIWAWKAYRLKTIQRNVDHMAVFFPFEKKIYDNAGVPCTVVGHPLTKKVNRCDEIDLDAKKELGFDLDKTLIALCPGSRTSELSILLPIIIEATQLIKQQLPEAQFALLAATSVSRELLKDLPDYIQTIPNEKLNTLFRAADAGIVVSGTITLEAACNQLPISVIYKMSPINYAIGKRLIKTAYIALCNIVCQKALVKEFIQDDANPEQIAKHTLDLVADKNSRKNMGEIFSCLPPASHAELIPATQKLIQH